MSDEKTVIDVSKLPIERWEIGKLVPHPQNAKKHPPEKTEALAKSIKRIGMANPIQVEPEVFADGERNENPGTIIAGHGRRMAAQTLGWTHVPVIVRRDLTRTECAALRISDNQTASTEYDTELLQIEIAALDSEGFDMDSLGFDDAEIERMTSDFGAIDDQVFVEDITTAVEEQKAGNAAREAEIDQTAAPVSDALGFKRVTVEQSRQIRTFMTAVEAQTGKMGAEALVTWIAKQKVAA